MKYFKDAHKRESFLNPFFCLTITNQILGNSFLSKTIILSQHSFQKGQLIFKLQNFPPTNREHFLFCNITPLISYTSKRQIFFLPAANGIILRQVKIETVWPFVSLESSQLLRLEHNSVIA